ncbi:MAG: hypothetical protein QOJ12_1938, partial [Thermoleophilales bacterium]|nr:hypothetical protein [Thermoleophilales bacterium]
PPAPPSHVTSVLPKQRSPWPLVIAIVVVLLIAGGVAIALLSGGSSTNSASGADQQQARRQQQREVVPTDQLRAPVEQMGSLLDLSAEGRSVTEAGDFNAAAANRQQILDRLGALSVPADLEPSHALFQQAMRASLQADLAHLQCGTCPAATRADRRATFLKRQLVRTFNPFAQRYLQRSFDPNNI